MKLVIFFVLLTTFVFSQKIDPKVYQDFKDEYEVMIYMQDQINIDYFNENTKSLNYDQKAQLLLQILLEQQRKTQKEMINELKSTHTSYESFYLPNCIWARLSKQQLESLAQRKDIKNIFSNKSQKIHLETPEIVEKIPYNPNSIEWNIKWINADKVWEKGVRGEGIIVANSDTGVKFDHPALIKSYLGNKGDKIEHDYAWWDGLRERIDRPRNICGYNLTSACDDYGHGT